MEFASGWRAFSVCAAPFCGLSIPKYLLAGACGDGSTVWSLLSQLLPGKLGSQYGWLGRKMQGYHILVPIVRPPGAAVYVCLGRALDHVPSWDHWESMTIVMAGWWPSWLTFVGIELPSNGEVDERATEGMALLP